MPLHPTLDSYYKYSGYMCGWAVLPRPTEVPRTPQQHPIDAATSPDPAGSNSIVWQSYFLTDITSQPVSWDKPEFQVTNSDLELAGIVIRHTYMADCVGICERTKLS